MTPGRRLVLTCGGIELLSWGCLYYAVPVVHDRMTATEGWSPVVLTLTYSSSLAVAALLSPRVGRLVDGHGLRDLVTVGAVAGAAGLLLVAAAPSPAVVALGMLVVGVGQAATLYPPVFAALTTRLGARSAAALTVVSLFGGISSTVVAPVLAPLAEGNGWRPALAGTACVYLLLMLPLARHGLRDPWRPAPGSTSSRRRVRRIVTSRRFRALQAAVLLGGLGLYGATLNLIPLARESGHDYAFAAVAFGLVGAGQVAGRLLYLPLAGRGGPRARVAAQVGASVLVLVVLAAVSRSAAALVAVALAAGAVRGLHTLVATIGISDRWGARDFGSLSGHFNRPVALAIAVAPFAGAGLASVTGSYAAAVLLLALLAALGLGAAVRT